MSLFELLGIGVLVVATAVVVMLAIVVVRNTPRSAAGHLVGQGDFARALESADVGPGADRDELLATAFAAKHLLELDRARELLDRILAADDSDGEAWMERGLVQAYEGDYESAGESLAEAGRRRADLLESIGLHRAWAELRAGDEASARRRFEEIAPPIRTKLESDLGPGDPLFAEWFFQAGDLWEAAGESDLSEWAREQARFSAPESRLVAAFSRNPP
jgi:tetratricopeptide (TPR) repeat protein